MTIRSWPAPASKRAKKGTFLVRFVQRLRRLFGGDGNGVSRGSPPLGPSDAFRDAGRLGEDRIDWADRDADVDAELFALEEELARLSGPVPDRAAVDVLLCPACGVFGEHLLDRDGFPVECRSCGWEGGAV